MVRVVQKDQKALCDEGNAKNEDHRKKKHPFGYE
jgi:hypothetical protein